MRAAINTGVNFGLTSGVITTLGLIVGLHSGTHSSLAVIGGIVTIAIADAMSDALGIHISQESDLSANKHDVWLATLATLASKMVMAFTFMIPILMFDLTQAIIISVVWGSLVITVLSYVLAKRQNEKAMYIIGEHLAITLAVIVTTHFVGDWVAITFGQAT